MRTIRRSYFGVFTVLAAMALLCVLSSSSTAAAGDTTLVSVDGSGAQGNGFSGESDISDDGRYVVFTSTASNLDPDRDDANGFRDVFVRDLQTETTERVSVDDSGTEADAGSSAPSISGNGRYVAFVSDATNLVPGDDNGMRDVFVRDLKPEEGQTETFWRVSVDDSGAEANNTSERTSVSSNGRVAFVSEASNLVPGDTNNFWDFFVHDLNTHKTTRVNVDEDGNQVNGGVNIDIAISSNGRYVGFTTSAPYLDPDDPGDHWDGFVRDLDPVEGQTKTIWRVAYDASGPPRISDDGRVAFASYATNLVAGDTNGFDDIFVRDLEGRTTQRVSVGSSGTQANGRSSFPAISSDGCFVAFVSDATNLVPGDTNGFRDVFVRDLQAQTTDRVSVDSSGSQGNGHSFGSSISSEGRYVAFNSGASNLVAGDTNSGGDVFVHERQTEPLQSRDCTAPTTTATATTNSGADYTSGTWSTEDVKVGFRAQDDEGGDGIREIRYSASGAQSIPETVYNEQNPLPIINTEGTTTISYFATDNAGNREFPAKTLTVKINKSAPRVDTVSPNSTTGVPRSTDVVATFSEKVNPASFILFTSGPPFKLFKCSSTKSTRCDKQVTNAPASLSTDGLRATLNPYGTSSTSLDPTTKYKAVITTGVTDQAGTPLDQEPSAVGNQEKIWYFTTGRTL